MRRPISLLLLLAAALPAMACDVCQKNQPEPLRGITHGTGPQSQWDMPIVWISAIIVGITLFLSVRMLVRPGEQAPGHIKRMVLDEPALHHGE